MEKTMIRIDKATSEKVSEYCKENALVKEGFVKNVLLAAIKKEAK